MFTTQGCTRIWECKRYDTHASLNGAMEWVALVGRMGHRVLSMRSEVVASVSRVAASMDIRDNEYARHSHA